jgi:peptidoglycan L-alanyl-D-glutamate endopeptidase CwlK
MGFFQFRLETILEVPMLIFIALLYVCGASGLIWLAVFPTGRALATRGIGRLRALVRHAGAWGHAGARGLGAARDAAVLILRERLLRFLRRHRVVFAIVAPVEQVAALLAGEQLAPPVALPPDVFTTAEVELIRPMLVGASRNWGLLHPDFSARLLLAFKIMKEQHGYEMALLEGYRSPARQDALAASGSNVTNARAFQSWHQYGLAGDCAFLRDGKLVISEKDPWAMRGYQAYGQVAESLGLTWGGRWKMMDFGHTELRLRGVMRR